MITKNKSIATEEKKGRVKVGKLKATKELSAEDAKKVKGGIVPGRDRNKYLVIKMEEI